MIYLITKFTILDLFDTMTVKAGHVINKMLVYVEYPNDRSSYYILEDTGKNTRLCCIFAAFWRYLYTLMVPVNLWQLIDKQATLHYLVGKLCILFIVEQFI